MESTGPITLLYIFFTLPKELGIAELPWGNWTMAGCYVCQLLPSTAKTTNRNTDYSLRLPRCPLAAVPQSKHVTHESARLPDDACLPGHQRYLNRRIPLWLWTDNRYRLPMARPCRMDVSWTCSLVLGSTGQHVPRRRPSRDPSSSGSQTTSRGCRAEEATSGHRQGIHDT
jgi:hypothetical protein